MEFRILGPLEVTDGDLALEIAGSKRRALLALLILRANEVVRTDRLIDDLWGESPPTTARGALQNHVSRLRKSLGPDVLVRREWGYTLRTPVESIDLRRFEQLLREADPLPAGERSQRLAEALALWRGPPLSDVAGEPALRREISRLDELRVSTIERRVDADLETGRSWELIPELEGLLATYPLREHLRSQLILALYRANRQAEALEVYRETRRVLADELGLEPGPELRELERAILRQDPSLGAAEGLPPPPVRAGTPLPPASRRRRWLAGGIAGVLALAAIMTLAALLVRGKRDIALSTTTVVTAQAGLTGPVTITDRFDGTAVDAQVWSQFGSGSGWTLTEGHGHLEFRFSPKSQPAGLYNNFGGQIGTQCTFPGDFDAQVSFELVSWPAWNGVYVQLTAFLGQPITSWAAGRTSDLNNGEEYTSNAGGIFTNFVADDTAGSFRVRRRNGVVTTYRKLNGEWEKLTSGRDADSGSIAVQAQGTSTKEFVGQPVIVDFKDFSVTAKAANCPPGAATGPA